MKKIAVAITGASGSVYAKLLLQKLSKLDEQVKELSIVMTENARLVWNTELGDETYQDTQAKYFDPKDFTAPFASGSAKYDALIIVPCSMGTLGRIASGMSNDLITRAADVMLKESPTSYSYVKTRSVTFPSARACCTSCTRTMWAPPIIAATIVAAVPQVLASTFSGITVRMNDLREVPISNG